jgi:ribosomal protein L11 methyltransferase
VDWSTSWRDGIIVRQFGRLTLSPTWLADSAGNGPRVILDPESAFGSGEHGSTRAALTLLDRHVKPKDRVLDLGSGSGILSIGAVKLGAAWAVGVEVDDESLPVAERNAEYNGVTDQVQFIHGDAADVAPLFAPVDLVLSNILRVVNVALLAEIIDSLRPGGIAIFSGMEEAEEPLFLPELAGAGLTVVDEARDAGWWAVATRR